MQSVESLRTVILEDEPDFEPAVKQLERILATIADDDLTDTRRVQVSEILLDNASVARNGPIGLTCSRCNWSSPLTLPA